MCIETGKRWGGYALEMGDTLMGWRKAMAFSEKRVSEEWVKSLRNIKEKCGGAGRN